MRRLVAVTSSLAALAATVTIATPASADTLSFRDPRGDAVARYDLTKVKVVNANDRLAVKVRLRDLRGDRTQIFGFGVTPVRGDTIYSISTVRRPNGSITARFTGYSGTDAINVECKVVRSWAPAKNTIAVSFDRDCIPDQSAVRVNVYIGAGNGRVGDPADWTKIVRVDAG